MTTQTGYDAETINKAITLRLRKNKGMHKKMLMNTDQIKQLQVEFLKRKDISAQEFAKEKDMHYNTMYKYLKMKVA